jgi:hypothetical protein
MVFRTVRRGLQGEELDKSIFLAVAPKMFYLNFITKHYL